MTPRNKYKSFLKPFQITIYNYYKLITINNKTMTNLQEVQVQITEMIKKDYPNPIFKVVNHDKMIFQFDAMSYHGEIEIIILKDGNLYMNAGNIECIGSQFMYDFKQVYKNELIELSCYRG